MRVRHRASFAASADAVFDALTSPDLIVAKYRHLGHLDVRIVEHREQFGVVIVRSRREVPTAVPDFALRYFRPMTVVEEHQEWDPLQPDGSRRGTWQVTARGVPVTAGGVQRLVPVDADVTEWLVEGEVVCPMPGEQTRLAEMVRADIERQLAEGQRFIAEELVHRSGAARDDRSRSEPR